MNDETRERLVVILCRERHGGFMSFLVEEAEDADFLRDRWSALLDQCSCLWNLLPENEKLTWDTSVELEGGVSRVFKVLKMKREKVLKTRREIND